MRTALQKSVPNRGIVTCAGGARLFTCVYVMLRMLRDVVRCDLPVEVWYLGESEMDPAMLSILTGLRADAVDATRVAGFDRLRVKTGWPLKPFAIRHSRFSEVIFLDADNTPVVNPEALFDTGEYRRTGAIFWPDIQDLDPTSGIWSISGLPFEPGPAFESGQIVIDKHRCMDALQQTLTINEQADYYYQFVHGDKDTFLLGWRLARRRWAMPPFRPSIIEPIYEDRASESYGPVLGQHGFDSRVWFQHRNWPKWIMLGHNARYPGLRFEEECLGFLDDLKKIWNGRVSTLRLEPPHGGKWFRYVLVSSSERLLEFLPNQRIGHGNTDCERRWSVVQEAGTSVLEILGDGWLTCRLQKSADGIWRRRWHRNERYYVELIPLVG